ncbi:MAG: hypothetical protein A3H35_14610 [Betaproteobacteria bacterium RIFCSPLOWO2_02_FULL_62_17]|nr:MAG: hypothetical protein A3H35_14610 [Betaproteobacteria bacterium RIFCSPLOWO2_02_FULL_62_17]
MRVPYLARYFAEPDIAAALVRITAAGEEIRKLTERADAFEQELANLGYPLDSGAGCHAPYDYFADYLRGYMYDFIALVTPSWTRDAVDARLNEARRLHSSD